MSVALGHDRGDRALLTVAELAELIAVPTSWVYAKVAAGELPHLKIGRYVRFDPRGVETYLENQRRGPGELYPQVESSVATRDRSRSEDLETVVIDPRSQIGEFRKGRG